MPISLTSRLDTDELFRKTILKVGQDYVQHARATLDYYTADFDAAHDVLMCYATLNKKDYVALAKGNPRLTATPFPMMTTRRMHMNLSFSPSASRRSAWICGTFLFSLILCFLFRFFFGT